jgi:hypothetical protein
MKARIIAMAMSAAIVFPGAAAGSGPRPAAPTSLPPVVVKVSDGGFRWGDAAVGAAAASGTALALGGIGMSRRQLRKEKR